MITAALTALIGVLKASDLMTKVAGLWFGFAPGPVEGRYITLPQLTNIPDNTMDSAGEEISLQISIWTDELSPTGVISLTEELWSICEDPDLDLAIEGGACVMIIRDSSDLLPDPDGGWQYQTTYRINVEET